MAKSLRARGAPRRAPALFQTLAERLELADEGVDVGAERRHVAHAVGMDGELDSPSDSLVELGVDDAEAVAGIGGHVAYAFGRRQLRAHGGEGPVDGRLVVGVAAIGPLLGLQLLQLGLHGLDVELLVGVLELVPLARDPPAFVYTVGGAASQ